MQHVETEWFIISPVDASFALSQEWDTSQEKSEREGVRVCMCVCVGGRKERERAGMTE